mmetsp:Transcript_117182/g.338796  ORF Transcript_117182/g.338796 Transcript_117182/m.338796 type:complete len:212 (-) Transcript_117182:126-761(-)
MTSAGDADPVLAKCKDVPLSVGADSLDDHRRAQGREELRYLRLRLLDGHLPFHGARLRGHEEDVVPRRLGGPLRYVLLVHAIRQEQPRHAAARPPQRRRRQGRPRAGERATARHHQHDLLRILAALLRQGGPGDRERARDVRRRARPLQPADRCVGRGAVGGKLQREAHIATCEGAAGEAALVGVPIRRAACHDEPELHLVRGHVKSRNKL